MVSFDFICLKLISFSSHDSVMKPRTHLDGKQSGFLMLLQTIGIPQSGIMQVLTNPYKSLQIFTNPYKSLHLLPIHNKSSHP